MTWLDWLILMGLCFANGFLFAVTCKMERHAKQVYRDGFAAYDRAKASYADALLSREEARKFYQGCAEETRQLRALFPDKAEGPN